MFVSCSLLTIAMAAPARAATTIGDATSTPNNAGTEPFVYLQQTDPADAPYGVPAGGGVITSVSAKLKTSGTVVVARPAGAGTYSVVGTQELSAPTSSLTLVTAPTRIPVAAGDRLAVHVRAGSEVGVADGGTAAIIGFPAAAPPTAGQALTGGDTPETGFRMLVSATVEPDADHDGYGDETQDTCATNGATHTLPCTTDLSVGAAASPAAIAQGDVTTIVAPITANGVAPGAVATLGIPAGLGVIAASTTAGDCAGVTCPLGDLAPGETRKAYIVVRGTAVGTHALAVSAVSSLPDHNPWDNGAAALVTVTAPPPVALPPIGQAPAPPPAAAKPIKLCRVPSLRNKTAAAAKKALTKAGCRAGKAKGSKAKKAKVRTQTIPAGVRVVAGTKVGYSLKAPAKKKATKKKTKKKR
jgi:hypothetical protein